MEQQWQTGNPPNETPVEVEYEGSIITVEAVYGGFGYWPHWRSTNGTFWDLSAFRRWRNVSPNTEPTGATGTEKGVER